MRCSSCETLLDRYVEGTLTPRDMLRVRDHVKTCAHCAALVHELRVVDALLASSAPVELAPNFTFAVVAEARATEVLKSKRRPIWPVLTSYIVAAWIALALCLVVFGPHLGVASTLARSVFSQIGTAFSVLGRSFGASEPAVATSVLVILAIDAAIASAAIHLYRRARARTLRSEAS